MDNIRHFLKSHCDVLAVLVLIALFGLQPVERLTHRAEAGMAVNLERPVLRIQSLRLQSPICREQARRVVLVKY